jgi:ribosome-binding protein aMBF1 (putative translation factor)
MNHQDWNTITINKTYTKKEEKQKFGTVKKVSPTNHANGGAGVPAYKMDDPDFKPKTVAPEIGRQIEQGRLAKKWNQEQLAREAQLPLPIIKSYERPTSDTVINHQYVQKIGRALGIQIKKP